MKHLILMLILGASSVCFGQEGDSIRKPKKSFESFFGCDCCPEDDTIRKEIGYRQKEIYQLVLYRSQYLLEARVEGKVLWKTDLRKMIRDADLRELCIFDGGKDKKGCGRVVISAGHSAATVLCLKNGKRVK